MKELEVEILLVEDNRNDAELTIRALKKHNITNKLIHLADGSEAVDFLFGNGNYSSRNLNNKPKVILLDLKMPKVGGLELLEILKSNDQTKSIPIVILTSSKEHPDVERAYEHGANSYIVKPVDFTGFVKAVKDLGLYLVLLN